MKTPPEVLCKGMPSEFVAYFQYVRALHYDEKPDYAYLRRMFRSLFAKEGACMHVCVCALCWLVLDACVHHGQDAQA